MALHSHAIVVIGGGFSGTVLAANLLRRPPAHAAHIVLVERSAEPGRGLAYARRSHPYLLNVPAGRMSAESDRPGAFLDFVRRRNSQVAAGDFVPRAWYGDYLHALLLASERIAPARIRFERMQGEAVDVKRDGRGLRIALADGRELFADDLVLACGNPPPARLPALQAVQHHPRHVANGCADDHGQRYHGTVLLIGTGLTMADVAVAAAERDDVVLHAISRHGLVPSGQTLAGGHGAGSADLPLRLGKARTVRELLRSARTLAGELQQCGGDWRDVVAAIRERAPQIWRDLDVTERQRFLRHLRPYWDIHRHRLPAQIHAHLMQLRDCGRLHVHAGRVVEARPEDGRLQVSWRPRGEDSVQLMGVDWVVNCTGPDYDIRRTRNPLLQSLLRGALAAADESGLGLRTGAHGALLDSAGRTSRNLYCLGPLLRAAHWESTAVAELRGHAESLAAHLAGAEVRWPSMAGHKESGPPVRRAARQANV
ncbi:MAG: FAD/NAD(P)-binding protein [Steroidobacteraceae bacterium]